ncbi:hypothetical protein [uncultured Parvibaculum sp.]|uniref:hypothetical protein n=3 Tax=Parvibaculum TaxID=256616 RepID=UPI0030DA71DB
MKLQSFVLALALGVLLAACGSRDPYQTKYVYDETNALYHEVSLRDVHFAPSAEEVYPVEGERMLVPWDQTEMQANAKKWLQHYLEQKQLAAASAEQARYFLDVDVEMLEVIGEPKGMAYRTQFVYHVTPAGDKDELFNKKLVDGGYTQKPDNLTWGNVIAAAGAGLAGGLTGIRPTVMIEGAPVGSRSGLQPSVLQKALVYSWRDAIARNTERFYNDLPSSVSYRSSLKQSRNRQQALKETAED